MSLSVKFKACANAEREFNTFRFTAFSNCPTISPKLSPLNVDKSKPKCVNASIASVDFSKLKPRLSTIDNTPSAFCTISSASTLNTSCRSLR